ncbi:hypothetical protein [Caballeronia grimmiae]|jgi:hypothetical protein|uniref:hypothetical protein n=1 Tax=Caballeronia grimmiae TaxID=1071679 RepID=UPI0038BCA629
MARFIHNASTRRRGSYRAAASEVELTCTASALPDAGIVQCFNRNDLATLADFRSLDHARLLRFNEAGAGNAIGLLLSCDVQLVGRVSHARVGRASRHEPESGNYRDKKFDIK